MANRFNIIKVDDDNRKGLTIFFLIMIGFVSVISIYISYNSDNWTRSSLLNRVKNTRVVDIYINQEEHNSTYVKYSNGKTEGLGDPYQVGDSISKNKGDSIEYIFRKGEILQIIY